MWGVHLLFIFQDECSNGITMGQGICHNLVIKFEKVKFTAYFSSTMGSRDTKCLLKQHGKRCEIICIVCIACHFYPEFIRYSIAYEFGKEQRKV